jgi:hypothetical protein
MQRLPWCDMLSSSVDRPQTQVLRQSVFKDVVVPVGRK